MLWGGPYPHATTAAKRKISPAPRIILKVGRRIYWLVIVLQRRLERIPLATR